MQQSHSLLKMDSTRICLNTSPSWNSAKTFCKKHNTKQKIFGGKCKESDCDKDPTICCGNEQNIF